MSSFLSSSCERRFPELEYYFCYGCHYTEPESTDNDAKTITLCKDFAERLWGATLDTTTTEFDSCGFNLDSEGVVIPSSHWDNGNQFFVDVLPPLFGDYTIVIAESNENCFNKVWPMHIVIFLMIMVVIYEELEESFWPSVGFGLKSLIRSL